MGTTNMKASLEDRIAVFKGELEEVDAEIIKIEIEEGIDILQLLKNRRKKLHALIGGAEDIIFDSDPNWRNKVKPRKKHKWHSPFRSGELGRFALCILRERSRWMRPREVAREMLLLRCDRVNERVTLDKVTNSVSGYFAKHEGDLLNT